MTLSRRGFLSRLFEGAVLGTALALGVRPEEPRRAALVPPEYEPGKPHVPVRRAITPEEVPAWEAWCSRKLAHDTGSPEFRYGPRGYRHYGQRFWTNDGRTWFEVTP